MLDEINPYTVGNPIDGSDMFFGRDDVFFDIKNKLIGRHRNNVIVLCGQRRIGKTSVLYQMRNRLGPGYLCILIDFHALMLTDLSNFLLSLANAIADNLQSHYNITMASPPTSGAFLGDPGHSFTNVFLSQLWAAIGNRHVLLMLDEATRLQEQYVNHEILEYLRYLIQHHANLDFLFSFSNSLEEMKKEHTFLLNICLYKKISFLDQDSAYKLVTVPVKNFYTIEPLALERFFQLTSGHPYYIQLLCMNIFLNWQAQFRHGLQGSEMFINQEVAEPQISRIEVKDVEAAISQSLEAGGLVLRDTWNESTDGEKAILASIAALMDEGNQSIKGDAIDQLWLARFSITIPERDKVKSMQLLEDRDIISDSPYTFKVELFCLWVKKYKSLDIIKVDEIADTISEWRLLTEPTLPLQEETSSEPSASPSSTTLSFSGRLRFFLEAGRSLVSWAQSGQPQRGIWSSTDEQASGHYPISRRKFAWAGLAGLGVVAVGGIALLKLSLSSSPSRFSPPHVIGDTLFVYSDHNDPVYTVAWAPNGQYIASGGGDRTVRVWNAFSGKTIAELQDSNFQYTVYSVAWAQDSNRIAVGDGSGTIKIWSCTSKKIFARCVGHSKAVYTLAWSPDNQYLVSGSVDATMRIWDAASGKQIPRYAPFSKDHHDTVYAVAWSNDGNYIASVGGADRTIEIFNFAEVQGVLAYADGSNYVYAVAWAPDGQYIVTGGQDTWVKIWKWNVSSRTIIKVCKGHKGLINAVSWSPNEKYIASASADKTVKVWNAATGQLLFTYKGHQDIVNDVAWSPDSKYIASAGGNLDGTVRVWRAPD